MFRSMFAAALLALPIVPAAAQDLPQLRVSIAQDTDALDPTVGRAYVGRVIMLNMCDSLFTYNDKLAIVPRLATGYEWTDSKTLVVKLRPGVVFQDGTPVDAAAVKYSLERHATMSGSARRGDVSSLDHSEIAVCDAERFLGRSELGAVTNGKLVGDLPVDADPGKSPGTVGSEFTGCLFNCQ